MVQTPANCSGCSGKEGALFDDPATGLKFYLNPEERGRFSTPGAGEFGNTGRNFFTGPGSFRIDLGVLKRFRLPCGHSLEYRAEATNLTNTPTFGFPTATITSAVFGRVRDNVISSSRKIQMRLKYTLANSRFITPRGEGSDLWPAVRGDDPSPSARVAPCHSRRRGTLPRGY